MIDDELNNTSPGELPTGTVELEGSPFWSPWATVGLGLLVAIAYVLVQLGVAAAWVLCLFAREPGLDQQAVTAGLQDGDLFAAATLATSLVCSAMVLGFARLKRGADAREVLALGRPTLGALAFWGAVTVAFAVASDALRLLLGRPVVPEFMTDLFRITSTPLLLWLAVAVAAPLFEELFVRGFLLEGLRRGSLGNAGAVVVTSLAWTVVHLQYDLFDLATVFAFGLVLGAARLRSGSLWIPIALHVLVNLVATVQTTMVLRGG